MKIPSKFEFEKRARLMTGTAIGVITEALQSTNFNSTVTFSEHRLDLAYTLLGVRPDLVGVLPAIAETNVGDAVWRAIEALDELRTAEPLLFFKSTAPKSEVAAWLRRQYPARDRDELAGMVDRASAQEAWRLRYNAMLELAAKGGDVHAIDAKIAAIGGDNGGMIYTAPQTPDGEIAGSRQTGEPFSKIGGTS